MGPGTNAAWKSRHTEATQAPDGCAAEGQSAAAKTQRPAQLPSEGPGAEARPAPQTPARSTTRWAQHAPARPSGPTTNRGVQEAGQQHGEGPGARGAHEAAWGGWCSRCDSATNSCPALRNPTGCSPLDPVRPSATPRAAAC